MRIVALTPIQGNSGVLELTLSDSYLANLKAKLYLTKEDVSRLALRQNKEIALCIRYKDSPPPDNYYPEARASVTIGNMSIKRGEGKWVSAYGSGDYTDYVDMAILFEELNLVGNLLLMKEHAEGMGISVGDTIFLKVQPVRS